MDAPLQPAEGFFIWLTLDFCQIDFLDSETGVGQAERQLAVVGQDQQPFSRQVEPPDRENPAERGREKSPDGRTPEGIFEGHQVAGGLLEKKVDELSFDLDFGAVAPDDVLILVHPEAELFNNLIIDRDAAFLNPAVRLAARAPPRQRQKLVESDRQLPGQSEVDVEAEMKVQPAEIPLHAFNLDGKIRVLELAEDADLASGQ